MLYSIRIKTFYRGRELSLQLKENVAWRERSSGREKLTRCVNQYQILVVYGNQIMNLDGPKARVNKTR